MGALDGNRFSNTYAFYNSPDLRWKGVNVEVDPISYERLVINRKDDIANVNAAVCSESQTIHFARGKHSAVGGIWEFATPEYRDRWWAGMTLEDTVPVMCAPLSVILDQELGKGHHYFDFWSLDVDSALSVLEGTDFDRVGFGIIIVEKHPGELSVMDEKIEELLNTKGYARIGNEEKLCDTINNRDYWFMNQDFERIYAGSMGAKHRKERWQWLLQARATGKEVPLLGGDYATEEEDNNDATAHYGLADSNVPPSLDNYETEKIYAGFKADTDGLWRNHEGELAPDEVYPWARELLLPSSEAPDPSKETSMFWHIPKSGGTTAKSICNCLGKEVNVASNTLSWERAKADAAISSGKWADHVIFTSQPSHTVMELFTDTSSKGRMLALFRHPVDRLVSKFYYVQTA